MEGSPLQRPSLEAPFRVTTAGHLQLSQGAVEPSSWLQSAMGLASQSMPPHRSLLVHQLSVSHSAWLLPMRCNRLGPELLPSPPVEGL